MLVVDLEEQLPGRRDGAARRAQGELQNMEPDGKGRVRLEYIIPARGLIGFQTEFRTLTAGTGLLFHVFDHYGPRAEGDIGQRINGVLISNGTGHRWPTRCSPAGARPAVHRAPGEESTRARSSASTAKDNDLTVNALRGKQLTNFRASGTDEDEGLTPPIKLSLEQALEFIDDDELVEVTPKAIRMRKKLRTEVERKRATRAA
jgi:GTP-binding protein